MRQGWHWQFEPSVPGLKVGAFTNWEGTNPGYAFLNNLSLSCYYPPNPILLRSCQKNDGDDDDLWWWLWHHNRRNFVWIETPFFMIPPQMVICQSRHAGCFPVATLAFYASLALPRGPGLAAETGIRTRSFAWNTRAVSHLNPTEPLDHRALRYHFSWYHIHFSRWRNGVAKDREPISNKPMTILYKSTWYSGIRFHSGMPRVRYLSFKCRHSVNFVDVNRVRVGACSIQNTTCNLQQKW